MHCNSGHRIGTAEVESALVSHPQCVEAAVVGVEHEVPSFSVCCIRIDYQIFFRSLILLLKMLCQVKGQGIYAFVTLAEGVPYSEELRKSLIKVVREKV